jgi:predicted phosphodiesterase
MKIQIISDIHFESHSDQGKSFFEALQPDGIDVLVLAGDIATKGLISPSIKMFCSMYPDVVYVPGNHESYHRAWGWIDDELKILSQECPNLHVLQDGIATINGQRFLGCTLWYPQTRTAIEHRNGFSDFLYIFDGFINIFDQHKRSKRFLSENVRKGDIVVTHHMPTFKAIHPDFKNSTINDLFACNMENIIRKNEPSYWIFGHTHNSYEGKIKNTKLICNPFGYLWRVATNPSRPQENLNFDYNKIIEI